MKSVVMPAKNEPYYIAKKAYDSIKSQNPDEIIFVSCDYEIGYTICEDKPGKLYARDLGIKEAKGDIIVAVDADQYYPPGWLKELTKFFGNKEYVAATQVFRYPQMLPSVVYSILYSWRRMWGSGSAFYKWAYEAVGGFHTEIGSIASELMIVEEEFLFYEKLSTLGKIGHSFVSSIPLADNIKEKRGIRSAIEDNKDKDV